MNLSPLQRLYRPTLCLLLPLIGLLASPALARPLSGDAAPISTLRGVLVDTTGLPLEGPQDIIVHFYDQRDADTAQLELRATGNTRDIVLPSLVELVEGRFEIPLDPRQMVDGPAEGMIASHAELEHLTPAPWLALEVDGTLRSARVQFSLLDPVIDLGRLVVQPMAAPAPRPQGQKAANSDPALHTDYSSTCTWRITCGGIKGQMRWPTTGSCWDDAVPNLPLAVILKGNGFDYRDYDYLQTHLAKNGILSASINKVAPSETVAGHQEVADDAEAYLTSACFQSNFLDNFSSADPVDFDRTALVGHSRGGESVRYLADNLYTHADFTVRSVVSMAPTRSTQATLYGTRTPSHMVLYGTWDLDAEPDAVYASHDTAGWNEYSTPTSFDLDRSMKLFIGGTHKGFSDKAVGLFPVQWEVAQGYVHAFLRRWLLDDFQFYHGYIRGDAVPGTFDNGIYSQFSSAVARRVIDNFQDLNVSPNTLGGNVSTFGVNVIDAVEATPIAETPHAGRVLRFTPAQDNAYVAWDIPAPQRNADGYLYLSLRLGMLEGSGPLQGRLWIKNGNNFAWVDLADYGGVPEPTVMCTSSAALQCFNWEDQGHMRTLRVPLSAFGAHNDVQTVYLQFLSGAVGDTFIVDNVEFSDAFVIAF